MKEGEAFGWSALEGLTPEDVTRRTGAQYDPDGKCYTLKVYGSPVKVCLNSKTMSGESDEMAIVIDRYAYFSKLSILSYLANAKDVPPTGHQVKPAAAGSLATFFQGSHELPLDGIAARYDGALDDFLDKGAIYNGVKGELGDASLKLEPFEGMPVEIVLWSGDDEFSARGDILFDSSCSLHVPPDIIWSVAMMSILILF